MKKMKARLEECIFKLWNDLCAKLKKKAKSPLNLGQEIVVGLCVNVAAEIFAYIIIRLIE